MSTLPSTDAGEFGSLSTAAQAEFDTGIIAIAKATQKSRKTLIARSSEEEYRWAVHNLDTARQLARCLPLTPPPGAQDQNAWNAWVVTFECRDSAMAKNVQWALEQEGRKGRLLVFAHNEHVMSRKDDGRRWAKADSRPSMMGLYLRLYKPAPITLQSVIHRCTACSSIVGAKGEAAAPDAAKTPP